MPRAHPAPVSFVAAEVGKALGGRTVLSGIGLELHAGETSVLLGANGAGKTTLLRILAGFLHPDQGTVTLDGIDVHRRDRRLLARIGYLPEAVPLHPEMRVMSYLRWSARLRGVPRSQVLQRVEAVLEDTATADVAHRRIGGLSRGYRQRVGLAQAIVHNPDVVLLDEPTSALDPAQIQDVRAVIRRLAHQRVVLVSTHLLAEADRIADRLHVVVDGRLVASDAVVELRRASGTATARVRTSAAAAVARGFDQVRSIDEAVCEVRAACPPETLARRVVAAGFDLLALSGGKRSLEDTYFDILAEAADGRR